MAERGEDPRSRSSQYSISGSVSSRPESSGFKRLEDLFGRRRRAAAVAEHALVAPGNVHPVQQVALGVLDDLVAAGRVVEGAIDLDPGERRAHRFEVGDD